MRSRQRTNDANRRSRISGQNYQDHCVIERSIRRSGLSRDSFVRILTQTSFSRVKFWTQTDLERLLVTAETLGLSPLSEDIYAAPPLIAQEVIINRSTAPEDETSQPISSPLTLVLSLQGWVRLINAHPQFEGVSFNEPEIKAGHLPDWMECTIHRRDRKVPIQIKEYMSEVNLMSGAWITHPRRMLRHKCLVQCAKLAFGFPVSLSIESDNEGSTSIKHSNYRPNGKHNPGKRKPADCSDLRSWLTSHKTNE